MGTLRNSVSNTDYEMTYPGFLKMAYLHLPVGYDDSIRILFGLG